MVGGVPAAGGCSSAPCRPAETDPPSPSDWPAAGCSAEAAGQRQEEGRRMREEAGVGLTSPLPMGTLMTMSSFPAAMGEPLTEML